MRVILSASKKVYFTLLASSFMFPIQAFAQCVENKDCSALGYKETTNKENCLKCPFGEYWFCPEPEEPEAAVLGQCTGYAKNCKIGDILNSDGTCTSDKVSSKTPIGVVVYIGGDGCGYAMSNSINLETSVYWGSYGIDIPSLPNYTNWQDAIKDFDVSGNMVKISQAGSSSEYEAAYIALNYAPDAAPETKGKWMLPTAGILNSLYNNLNIVTNTMLKIGGKISEHIWASTEYSSTDAWAYDYSIGVKTGGIIHTSKHTTYGYGGFHSVLAF